MQDNGVTYSNKIYTTVVELAGTAAATWGKKMFIKLKRVKLWIELKGSLTYITSIIPLDGRVWQQQRKGGVILGRV
jgi:hypothetical protein